MMEWKLQKVHEVLCIKQSELLIKSRLEQITALFVLQSLIKVFSKAARAQQTSTRCGAQTNTHPLMLLILFSGSNLRALEPDH